MVRSGLLEFLRGLDKAFDCIFGIKSFGFDAPDCFARGFLLRYAINSEGTSTDY